MLVLKADVDVDVHYVITESDGKFITDGVIFKDTTTEVATKNGRIIETFDSELLRLNRVEELKV